jgi:Mrp family chromosome partitioning ATPase
MISECRTTPGEELIQAPLAEHYKVLAERLRQMTGRGGDPLQLLGVTSSAPGEGVTTVAANLGATMSTLLDRPVLLVDANYGQPHLSALVGFAGREGLADVLIGASRLQDVIRPVDDSHVAVLPAGTPIACQRASYDPARLQEMMRQMQERFALVVFDLPAAMASSGCHTMAGLVDGVLLVLEAERARTQVARHVKKRLVDAHAQVLGVVLNKRPAHVPAWLYQRL